jgi:anti-anti-sigma factor
MQSHDAFSIEAFTGSRPGVRIVRLTGPFVLQHVPSFQDEVRKDLSPFNIVDLTGVQYMDSVGMGAIINFYVACERNHRKLVVTGVSERVQSLFKLTKVDSVLTIKPTIADAEGSF